MVLPLALDVGGRSRTVQGAWCMVHGAGCRVQGAGRRLGLSLLATPMTVGAWSSPPFRMYTFGDSFLNAEPSGNNLG
jgi:hypothetical protein